MQKEEIKVKFHNPNTTAQTAKQLLQLLVQVQKPKIEQAISQQCKENAHAHREGKKQL